MILIISTSFDPSTDKVIRWLNHLGYTNYLRFNCDDVKHMHIKLDNCLKEVFVNEDKVNSVWFRRPALKLQSKSETDGYLKDLNDFFYSIFYLKSDKIRILGSPYKPSNFNRLSIENTVNSVYKLNSETYITNANLDFENTAYVVKSIGGIRKPSSHKSEDVTGYHFKAMKASKNQGIRYYQKYIKNNFELRCVVVNDKIFSVLRCKDIDKEVIDIRIQKNIRYNTFDIPIFQSKKIFEILKFMDLNYSTLDVIIDQNNNYNIVDINPVGQYDDVDNFYFSEISKYISKYLAYEIQ